METTKIEISSFIRHAFLIQHYIPFTENKTNMKVSNAKKNVMGNVDRVRYFYANMTVFQ